MKIKTSELTGAALDWAVAKCLVLTGSARGFEVRNGKPMYLDGYWDDAQFHFNWDQGGPIIEREVCTLIERDGEWSAEVFWPKPPSRHRFCYSVRGETPLIAAMRTYVVSRLGAEVDVPEELLK